MKPGEAALSPMGEVMDVCWDYHSTQNTTFLVKLYVVGYIGMSFIYIWVTQYVTIFEIQARSIYLDYTL